MNYGTKQMEYKLQIGYKKNSTALALTHEFIIDTPIMAHFFYSLFRSSILKNYLINLASKATNQNL